MVGEDLGDHALARLFRGVLNAEPGPLFTAAVVMGIVTDAEGLATSVILSTWRQNVRSILQAVKIERNVVN